MTKPSTVSFTSSNGGGNISWSPSGKTSAPVAIRNTRPSYGPRGGKK